MVAAVVEARTRASCGWDSISATGMEAGSFAFAAANSKTGAPLPLSRETGGAATGSSGASSDSSATKGTAASGARPSDSAPVAMNTHFPAARPACSKASSTMHSSTENSTSAGVVECAPFVGASISKPRARRVLARRFDACGERDNMRASDIPAGNGPVAVAPFSGQC